MWFRKAHSAGLTYRSIIYLICLSLLATATEIFGVSIFLPIFQFVRLEGDINALVAESTIWQHVIESFNTLGLDVSLTALLLLAFILFLGRQIFNYLRVIYHASVAQKIAKNLRDKMFDRYLKANTSYYDSIPVGNLVNTMTTEVNAAVLGIMAPMELVVYFLMGFGYLFVLALLSWEMTLASVLVLLVTSRLPHIWVKKSTVTGRRLANANSEMSSFLVGRLRSPRLVRLAGTEEAEKLEFRNLTSAQRTYSVYSSILTGRTEAVMEPIVVLLSLVFLYVAYSVLNMKIELMGLYLIVALRMMPIVKGIIVQWQKIQRYIGSVEMVENKSIAMSDAEEHDNGFRFLDSFHNNIAFKNVCFRYSDNTDYVLKDISLLIPAGKMTAIVGPSGSGKSTLIDLLPRLRIPTEGKIEIDSHPINEYTLKSLRYAISYAPQSPQIFDGTVENHIRYGKFNASIDEIIKAAQLAEADSFIKNLKDGYQTVLGEEAVSLSGGQRQRLDLARALVREAPILILDEPTSNLDAESEEKFKHAIAKIRSETNITIIIIAHRLASVSDADNIIVLNNGKVEMSGQHKDLMTKSEWYENAWKIQSG